MAKVVVVGVRHHSPACARLVAHTIEKLKPRFVLVEGPCDMNERIDELLLGHQMPIALFSYRQNADGTSRGTWTPFCEFSPELVAMQKAKETGAKALWMDLPAWDDTFIGVENRFGSERMKHSDKLGEIADTLGFEDTDALWDHLFEQPLTMEELETGLMRYFDVLRADEPGGPRDEPREAVMTRFIAAAAKACADHGDGRRRVRRLSQARHRTAMGGLGSDVARRAASPRRDARRQLLRPLLAPASRQLRGLRLGHALARLLSSGVGARDGHGRRVDDVPRHPALAKKAAARLARRCNRGLDARARLADDAFASRPHAHRRARWARGRPREGSARRSAALDSPRDARAPHRRALGRARLGVLRREVRRPRQGHACSSPPRRHVRRAHARGRRARSAARRR